MSLGLVLGGGAARGAYQAGVLRYIYTVLPKSLGQLPWPDVVSGTSVGAMNATLTAARQLGLIEQMSAHWRQLEIDDVFTLHSPGFDWLNPWKTNSESFSALDTRPMVKTIHRMFPETYLRRAIASYETRALIIGATEYHTGTNVLWMDTADERISLNPLPGVEVVRTQMSPQHCIASAALPLLFPPVKVGPFYYLDGGLRQNTPLRPVLQTGVSHALVIHLHATHEAPSLNQAQSHEPTLYGTIGSSANAVLLDPITQDLTQARRQNRLFDWGVKTFGETFAQRAPEIGLFRTEILELAPSISLSEIALDAFKQRPPTVPPLTYQILSSMATEIDEGNDTDMLSLVLFDKGFTVTIEQLGFDDTAARHDEVLAFFEQALSTEFVPRRHP